MPLQRNLIVCLLSIFFSLQALQAEPVLEPGFSNRFSLLPKGNIDTLNLGVNAFANDLRFGSVKQQYLEVRNTLKIKFVRVLFAWNDQVQPARGAPINFAFYDDINKNIPAGVEAVVVLTGLPSWMKDSRNWVDGNPRKTFVQLWVQPVVARYATSRAITAWQILNEPNMLENPDNTTLAVSTRPENYVELLGYAYPVVKQLAPRDKVVGAASTSINQNYPTSLNYNKLMKANGAEQLLDVWAIHYYGMQIENILRPGGVKSFVKSLARPVWVTESGEKGTTKQKSYAQRVWPFLQSQMPGIQRIYQYQFTDSTAAEQTYGLRNLTPGKSVSDLYIFLRDRVRRLPHSH